MKSLTPLVLLLCCILFSCKNTEKSFKENTRVQKATWSHWSGGMQGVGGNVYLIEVKVAEGQKPKAQKLIIDDQEVEITSQIQEGNLMTITATENKSNVSKTVGSTTNTRPGFRTENPTKASIELSSDCCKLNLPITTFEKGQSPRF